MRRLRAYIEQSPQNIITTLAKNNLYDDQADAGAVAVLTECYELVDEEAFLDIARELDSRQFYGNAIWQLYLHCNKHVYSLIHHLYNT